MQITVVSGGTIIKGFNFDRYSKMAFDWLSCGEDHTISAIITTTENDYKQVFHDNPTEVKNTIETGTLEKSVVSQLKFGVSQLLYYKFLKQQLEEIVAIPLSATENKSSRLKVKQIALIYVYNEIQITRDNAIEIATKYGYTSKTSGEGLFQDYTNFSSLANRKGRPFPFTSKKLQNKIKLFESIIEQLTDKAKQKAIDEIKTLKTLFENEY